MENTGDNRIDIHTPFNKSVCDGNRVGYVSLATFSFLAKMFRSRKISRFFELFEFVTVDFSY